ncbi:MAG: type II toxin-antitoxin system RelB/DinJ family antitoxin [Defluviitaleaceae bacterium]|nr:type II toxin-antitoxin system RelB/DinJ family antitoxin [Defluviitaleaceae bacterium]
MSQQVMLNLSIDKEVKESADNLFDKLGLNMATTVNNFLSYCLRAKDVPFFEEIETGEEYAAKIARSEQQLREGKTISFTMDEIESFEYMETDELMNFLETRYEESRAKWGKDV